MAWLQNLAGKAENFLNKIDQNAATVLNESTLKISESVENLMQPLNVIEPFQETVTVNSGLENSVISLNESLNVSPSNFVRVPTQTTVDEGSIKDNNSIVSEKSKTSDNDDGGILININNVSRESSSPFENVSGLKFFEREYTQSSISESMHASQIPEDIQLKYEEKISNLEVENQELNKRLLNLQHLYREIQNDNNNLQNQVDRANNSAKQAQEEMEHYKIRAQRVLQEKEKLIAVQKDTTLSKDDMDTTVINTYNEELKKETEFHQEKNRELAEKLNTLTKDFIALQQQYVLLQSTNQESKQGILNNLAQEKKYRMIAEEECRNKSKELQSALLNQSEQQNLVQTQYRCISELKEQLRQRNQISGNEDLESRLHTLTQTLMAKQSNLETITTERNALRIQLEKLEVEYRKLSQYQKTQVCISNVDDSSEAARSNVPKLMVVSPFDAGMTRRVKQTYSTLDALSIRTGIFLRRYPLARIFVFCYMVLLHIWVLIILSTYIPSTR